MSCYSPPVPTTITINNLSKHYPPLKGVRGSTLTRAVDDISLTIPEGSLFFLLGPSGCGKTTLLRMIAGFIPPTAGSIRFNDRDVSNVPPEKRNTGMVFQSYALWPHMTVEANVAFGLGVRKLPKAERDQRVAEALAAVRMDPYAKRKPNQLSGGQQQRVALARALVIRPDVLLLDEPLSNLDAKLRLEMRDEIRRICKETNITTVYVTHDQKEALSMADHVAVLDMGKVAQIGPPTEVYERPATRFVADFMGETNFIKADIIGRTESAIELNSEAGQLTASQSEPGRAAPVPEPSGGPAPSNVLCSIRPESWMFHVEHQPGAIEATVIDSIYLGEMAQHIVRAKDTTLRIFELKPRQRLDPDQKVWLSVDPADVVVLPA